MARVASQLFGADVQPDNIIGETLRRATPEGDANDRSQPFPYGHEATWCADSIGGQQVAYIRADLAAAGFAELREDAARLVHLVLIIPMNYLAERGIVFAPEDMQALKMGDPAVVRKAIDATRLYAARKGE